MIRLVGHRNWIGSCALLTLLIVVMIGIIGVYSFSQYKEAPKREHFIMSKLSEQFFSCSGTCYCMGKEDYRRISSVASFRTLAVPITAFSVVMALSYATTEFKTECFNLYSEECEGSITPAVEFCEGIEEKEDGGDQVSSDVKIPEKYENYEEEYECVGHCMKNGKLLVGRSRPEARKLAENYDCESLKTEGIVRVKIPRTGGKYLLKWNKDLMKHESRSDMGTPNLNQIAKYRFRGKYLIQFCKMNSQKKHSYIYEYPSGKTMKRKSTVTLCVGANHRVGGSFSSNVFTNIRCLFCRPCAIYFALPFIQISMLRLTMTRDRVLAGSFVLLLLIFVLLAVGISAFSERKANRKEHKRKQLITQSVFSELESRDFTCSGSCYCMGNGDYRRISTIPATKTIVFPITAISLVMALKYANDEFKTECYNQFSEECDGSFTQSVEFCESREDEDEEGDNDQVSSDVKIPEKWKDYEEEYECSGYCLKNGKLFADRARPEGREICENYDCESLTMNGIVRVKVPRTGGKHFQKWNKELKKQESSVDEGNPILNTVARAQFSKEYLTSFCKMNSKETYSYVYKDPKGYIQKKSNTASMCVARNGYVDGVNTDQLRNIRCKKIREIP